MNKAQRPAWFSTYSEPPRQAPSPAESLTEDDFFRLKMRCAVIGRTIVRCKCGDSYCAVWRLPG